MVDNIKLLPDAYYKGRDGNNYKLLHINELAIAEFAKHSQEVLNSLDIMQATGRTLDLFGSSVGVERGALDDNKFRLAILTQIGKNTSNGNYDSIVTLLAKIFDCSKSDININETDTSCEVEIINIPFATIQNAGYGVQDAIRMIEALLPVCVKVKNGFFSGTFEFGDGYDESTGFGNIEQTIGGFFGRLYY